MGKSISILPSDDDTWAFTLITPDGVLAGAIDVASELLQTAGFTIASAQLMSIDLKRMYRVYENTDYIPDERAKHPRIPQMSLRMFDDLYGLAPACLLMLQRPNGAACKTLAVCKGNTRPEYASSSSVRAQGENVILNYMHSPDDPASAVRELACIVGESDSVRLTEMTRRGPDAVEALVGMDALRASMPVTAGWSALSFPWIANRIRQRIVQRLGVLAAGDEEAITVLTRASEELADERRTLQSASGTRERMLTAKQSNDRVHMILSQATRHDEHRQIADGLDALSELHSLRGRRDLSSVRKLTDQGIYLSPLEEVAVEAHSYAFVPGEELTDMYPA